MKRGLIIGGAVVALGVGWALFRPELLLVNQTVNESFPGGATASAASGESGPRRLSMGEFRGLAHKTDGSATIYEGADGKRTLRLENFATSNGPALHVYLVAAEDANDNETVKKAGFIDLGALKGNKGDQNYEVPAGVDLEKHRAVSIWCARFGVNFATAPLKPGESVGMNGQPEAVATGQFRGLAHKTDGSATIYQLADGKRTLRLQDFATSNGPALHVYLVAAKDAPDNASVKKAGFIDLGALKGNKGDQNYEVPASVDLEKYRSVSIWCARFGVNFAAAPLALEQG